MDVLGLDHVQVAMPPGGEELAREFYGGVLGLAELPKPTKMRASGGAWFDVGATQLHLGVEPEFSPALKAHPGLRVADLDLAQRELAAWGAPVRSGADIPGFRRLFTEDPFGNRLELMQSLGGDAEGD